MTRQKQLVEALSRGLGGARHLVVAVSGGADSMALLHGLHGVAAGRGLRLTVAHLNHGLRGAAADADARFVRAEARRLGWPCVVGRAPVAAQAKAAQVSIEMAARTARYAFLVRTARRVAGAAPVAIVTAHTADDQAETLLLRLARGAGTRGLSGIPRQRLESGIPVIRPLLQVSREAVLDFLREGGHAWREDASNHDPAHLRNRVRHDVLPCLERTLNPRVRDALVRTADLLRDDETWMESLAEGLLREISTSDDGGRGLDVARLAAQPVAARRRVLRRWLVEVATLAPAALEADLVDGLDALCTAPRHGGRRQLPGGVVVVRQQGRLRVVPAPSRLATPLPAVSLPVPGETLLPDWGLRVVTTPGTVILRARPAGIGVLPASATLSWRRLGRRRLRLRAWRVGDRFAPLGMAGSQKLQDLFVNAGIPRERRAQVPIVVCGDDIVWVPGHRLARGWEIRDPGERMLQITIEPAGNH